MVSEGAQPPSEEFPCVPCILNHYFFGIHRPLYSQDSSPALYSISVLGIINVPSVRWIDNISDG